MPVLNLSELNIVLGVLGGFMALYGIISVKIKQSWYLGEALPAMVFGIILGPVSAKFLDSERWGSAEPGQTEDIALLVIAGYSLPAKYNVTRWKELLMCLLPIMTLMWLLTTGCILATIPKLSLLAALALASCVTCTDPVLSQAVAKGPFADKYVSRHLREIISSEAGANDGFAAHLAVRASEEVGRLGGGIGEAMKNWVVETWLYYVAMGIAYGAVVGFTSCKAIKYPMRRGWVDEESYLLFPAALGLFIIGTTGAIGTNDLVACTVAGNMLNWDGEFLAETHRRHDEVNHCIDVLLNFGGFMFIGIVLPWESFHDPDGTGVTLPRLIGLGFMVLAFRRIPAILLLYKAMPAVVKDYKEALFMGYFGPIGVGAVFYLEHMKHLFPHPEDADQEERDLLAALGPVIYFLVFFSIVVHGLSIPLLDFVYRKRGVEPIQDDAISIRRKSFTSATPVNAIAADEDNFIAFNRFSRPVDENGILPGEIPPAVLARNEFAVFSGDHSSEDDEREREEQEKRRQRRTIQYMV
uniref:Cation/H+ exchanger transmembrane domain-containing protein n=1 Tax=Fusarium oxysporum (strain Fo5176) TaxID=660025 RepID=A0A0D2YA29_FUSOF